MSGKHSVLVQKNYGKIAFRFKEVMDCAGVNRNQLATRAGIRFEVANRYYNGRVERIDADVLARICYVLARNACGVMEYRA